MCVICLFVCCFAFSIFVIKQIVSIVKYLVLYVHIFESKAMACMVGDKMCRVREEEREKENSKNEHANINNNAFKQEKKHIMKDSDIQRFGNYVFIL